MCLLSAKCAGVPDCSSIPLLPDGEEENCAMSLLSAECAGILNCLSIPRSSSDHDDFLVDSEIFKLRRGKREHEAIALLFDLLVDFETVAFIGKTGNGATCPPLRFSSFLRRLKKKEKRTEKERKANWCLRHGMAMAMAMAIYIFSVEDDGWTGQARIPNVVEKKRKSSDRWKKQLAHCLNICCSGLS